MQVDILCTCVSLVIDVKVCGIIGISKIKFFKFSGTKRVKQNKRNKHHSTPPKLVSKPLFQQFQEKPNIFLIFH